MSSPPSAAAGVAPAPAAQAADGGEAVASLASARVPLIDVAPLLDDSNPAYAAQPHTDPARRRVAKQIYEACTVWGFFYISGHGVSQELQEELMRLSKEFFALPSEKKMEIEMSKGGSAWRGYFPVGGELTSGQPDAKEGLYLGQELPPSHPLVARGLPLHGQNLFPDAHVPELRHTVLEYMARVTHLAHRVMQGVALALGLEDAFFFERGITKDPTVLFRIFAYPAPDTLADKEKYSWGVGEHTDYGLLTILRQDESGGLQVRSRSGQWVAAPPVSVGGVSTFVCNLGDYLDRLTGGRFKSTPHRVRNPAPHARISFPLFFDPSWDAEAVPLPLDHLPKPDVSEEQQERWDRAQISQLSGRYGDYLLRKVGKVFPNLKSEVGLEAQAQNDSATAPQQ